MQRALSIRLKGELSQTALEELRRRLDLQRRGRLTDEEDAEFGYRYLRKDAGNFVVLDLWREDAGDASWAVHLDYQSEAPDEDVVRQLRKQIVDAAGALGLTVEG